MQKYMRWSAILVVLMLVLAACQSDDPGTDASEEPDESVAAESMGDGNGDGSAADCDADEFGCIELAEGDPLIIGTALVITGANESLGLDSQYGAEVARTLKPEIAGHTVEFNHQDDGCSTEGGTAAARALVSEENIAGVIGTSCSSAGIPAAEIDQCETISVCEETRRLCAQRDIGMTLAAQALRERVGVEAKLRGVGCELIDRRRTRESPFVLTGEQPVVIIPEAVLVVRTTRGASGEERMRVNGDDGEVVVRVADLAALDELRLQVHLDVALPYAAAGTLEIAEHDDLDGRVLLTDGDALGRHGQAFSTLPARMHEVQTRARRVFEP